MSSTVDRVITQLQERQVYSRVAQQAARNAIVQCIGAAVVYWLAEGWRLGAILAFGVFVVTTALEALQVFGLTGAGIAVWVAGRRDPSVPRESGWMWGANLVRIASLALAVILLVVLANRLWP